MSSRVGGAQMPPPGSELIGPAGLAAIEARIAELDDVSCDAAPPVCSP
jgi:hypothetical protein